MTNERDMTKSALLRIASEIVNADDDQGIARRQDAQRELDRRQRVLEVTIEGLDFPHGRPTPSKAERIAHLLDTRFGHGDVRVFASDQIVQDILAVVGN